jgi:curli production assembly/transport component CsgF
MTSRWLALLCALIAAPALATEIVYRPVNPSFGGDPLNGSYLINSATSQNDFSDPKASTTSLFGGQSSLQVFTETLQRSILSRIASAISGSVVDASGNLIPGTVTIGNITVTIVNLGTTLRITTLDSATGQSSVFEVPK